MVDVELKKRGVYLGKTGETGRYRVWLDVSAWDEEYEGGVGLLLYTDPKGNTAPMRTVKEFDGEKTKLYGYVTAEETKEAGTGVIEVRWENAGVVAKSDHFNTVVMASSYTGKDIGENTPDWVSELMTELNAVNVVLDEAAQVAEDVAAIRETIEGAETVAKAAALDSEAWAVGERDGEDVDEDDPTYGNNARKYAQDAGGSAAAAGVYKLEAEAWAKGTKNGTAVGSTDPAYQKNAKYYADKAGEDAEAWANGTRNGTDVDSTDPAYHKNAKYWSDHAFSATPEGYEDLVDGVDDLKSAITGYNVFNFVPANGDFTTKTSNGVTFTWNDEHTVCTLNGTPTGYAMDRYFFSSSSLLGLEPGKTYLFNIIPSKAATGIDLYFYINGTLGTSIEITAPTYVTIPSNATGILSRVMAHSEAGAMTNATVLVEILNAPPVNDMLYARSAAPYVSNSTLTLGNIRENGWYVIDGSWTAADGPAELDGVGCLLTVECYSQNTIAQNMIKQTIEGVLAPNNRKVFKRLRAGGSWTSWADMTPFTRATIVPTGDSTDRTIEINAALSRDGVCLLAPGEYYVGNIEMPEGSAIKGSGIGTTKLIMISGESGPCVKMGTRCSVSDISLYGQDSSGYTTQGDRHGIGWVGTYQSESSPGEYPLQGQIYNLYIEGFNGGGLYCYRTSMHSESGIQAVNITIYKCWCGVYNPLISEYCQFTNIRVNSCLYGAYVSGGNNVFTNCSFTSCTCGLFMYDDGDTAANNSHGSFVGCCFNHSNNNTGLGISISGMDNGEVFVGCQIFYGRISIKWSKGIRFVGCNFGRDTGITVQNSSAVGFDACQFRSASDSPLTQTSATGLRFSGCMNYDGTEFNPLN